VPLELFALALTEGFVEEDCGSCGGVEGFDVALHGDLDAGVGGVNDFFGETGPFVADQEGDGLAPVEFPGGGGSVGGMVFVDAGGDGGDTVELELGKEDSESCSGDQRKMEGSACGGAKGLGREGTGGTALAGGGGDGSGGAESGGGAEDGADVSWILHPGENDEKWRTFAGGNGKEIFELRLPGKDKGGDALGVLGVGNAFKEAIGGVEHGEGEFGAIDERRQLAVMTLAGLAEEDGFDTAGGGEGFFNKVEAFDADAAGFCGQSAPKGHAEELEPAVVAAGDGGCTGFGGRGHRWQRSRNEVKK
jgi:hypothetical protein